MSQKLKILGTYTPEHEGPFCTRDGRPVRVLCSDMRNDYSIVAIVADEDGKETVSTFLSDGRFSATGYDRDRDLMCAREVPVAREFWVNEYDNGNLVVYDEPEKSQEFQVCLLRTIHVREVLPGEGE
ncbi:hypothetical protein SRCM100623_00251 [Acetobacter pasteurianus]|uniref:Uncharacterized protein n=1 Tax=Acetobacter pasteurianus TaxID=438 RepID=A0A1A0DMZ2_ACEPA|nr:hypothetical protein [Acetobacter pasteurianus]OAZ76390.1 hypothetical protein SRCM100623_00251 [Acetobacter pasteurianus]